MPEKALPRSTRKPSKKSHQPSEPGAKAIPAQRERRSRRAYRPQSGKMRADRPLRRAADKAHDMRQRRPPPHGQGEYGGRRGCRGVPPLTPCRSPRRRPRPDAGQKPQSSGKKEKRKEDATTTGRRAEAASQRRKNKRSRRPRPNAGGSSHPTEETCLSPVVSLRNEKVNRSLRATQKPKKVPSTQRAGREGDLRYAGAPTCSLSPRWDSYH